VLIFVVTVYIISLVPNALQDVLRQLTSRQREVERIVCESTELVKTSAVAQVGTRTHHLETKYTTLIDTAKVG